eukprot:COSAG06_NODE_63027_length_263_cov_0.914634_1_plen_36_part_10
MRLHVGRDAPPRVLELRENLKAVLRPVLLHSGAALP